MVTLFLHEDTGCITEDIIHEAVRDDWERSHIFVAPESSKAQVERMIISKLKELNGPEDLRVRDDLGGTYKITTSLVNGDVLSFMRLSGRILEISGRDTGKADDRIIMRNQIYRVLSSHLSEFRTLGKLVGKFEYIDRIISLIGDFTRYGIDEDGIAAALEESEDENLSDKLYDFKLLTGYLGRINEESGLRLMTDNITEANDLLSVLVSDQDMLMKERYRPLRRFLKSRFTVIGFGSVRILTPQEIKLVSLIDALGGDIDFYPLYSEKDLPVYEVGKMFVSQIKDNIPGCMIKEFETRRNDRGYLSYAGDRYAAGIDDDIVFEGEEDRGSIIPVSIRGTDDRIAYISNEIIRLTREEGFRYKDIRIVCADDDLIPRLTSVMKIFGLDIFIDRKIVINNTPVIRYVSYLLNMSIDDYSLDSVLRLLRTGLTPVLPFQCDLLENYCIRYNILSGRRLFDKSLFISQEKHPSIFYADGHIVKTAEYLWEEVIMRVLLPLREVCEDVDDEKTICGKARVIASHVDGMKEHIRLMSEEMFDRGDDELSSALVRGYNELMLLLASFTDPVNDTEITRESFEALIRIDMRNKASGTIPLKVDSIEIVSPEQSYITPCRIMFLIGARADNFPFGGVTEDLFTPTELRLISSASGCPLPDKEKAKNRSDLVTAVLMFKAVTDRLYLIHEYGQCESSAYSFFKQFGMEEKVNCFSAPAFGKVPEARHDPEECMIDKTTMDEILPDGKHVSVSSIEKYNSCHMRYMLNDILRIDERKDGTGIRANTLGTVVHAMFEYAMRNIVSEYDSSSALGDLAVRLREDKSLLDDMASRAFAAYMQQASDPSERTSEFEANAGRKARRIFSFALPFMLDDMAENHYIPTGFEQSLAEMNDPMEFIRESGKKFKFVGYIDRVDLNEETGSYRIIDYKTGDKKVELDKTLAGVQLQLFAYSNAVSRDMGEGKVEDAGYYEIGMKPEKEKELKLSPNMSGLKEDFGVVAEYVDRYIKGSCECIENGYADACVNSKSGSGNTLYCSYCPFLGCCGMRPGKPVFYFNSHVDDHGSDLKGTARRRFNIVRTMEDRMNGAGTEGEE